MLILYHPRCIKFLRKIPKRDSLKIVQTIAMLSSFPPTSNLDTKKLINTKRSFRLRIGNIRVIFEVYSAKKTIYINDIDFRGNIY